MMKKNKWTDEEVAFLRDNYPKCGVNFCMDRLNRSKNSIRKKVENLGIKMKVKNEKYLKDNFESVVKASSSFTDVARNLGLSTNCGNRNTIKKYIEKYNLDVSHFDFGYSNMFGRNTTKKDLFEILIENSTYMHTSNLRERLYSEGLKLKKCEIDGCIQGEDWMGNKISLILDHINGIKSDNRIENLRVICPNCNAALSTHGGKNINNKHKAKKTN